MTINPACLNAAKQTVFGILVTAAGSTAEKNAFLGYLPASVGTWALTIGGGPDVANTWNAAISELRMNSQVEGYFAEQADGDAFAMKILEALPIRNQGNVYWFRLRAGGMPDNTLVPLTVMNDPKPRPVWFVQIGCEIVFDTTRLA